MVDPGRSWPPSADGWPAVPFLHSVREAAIKDRRSRRNDVKSGPKTVSQGTPKRRTFGKRRRARLKRNSDIRDRGPRRELRLGNKETFMRPSDKSSDWRSRSEQSNFPSGCGKRVTGHCGEVGLLRNERRDVQSTAVGKETWWWYARTGSHVIREPLGTSGLKEGAAGAVGEESPRDSSHEEGRRDRSQTSQAQPSEKKKLRYSCRLFRTNSLKEGAVWHVDPLLDNDWEIKINGLY
jgi:hypothetical protein